MNGYSQINILARTIGYFLSSYGSSQLNISGGSISRYLFPSDHSKIQIFGCDFSVDGQAVGYGELTSIFGGWYGKEPYRRLSGTLLSRKTINNLFKIGNDATIVLVPEPATIILFALGALALRRKKAPRSMLDTRRSILAKRIAYPGCAHKHEPRNPKQVQHEVAVAK